jgi:hypothetical protein
MRRNACTNPVQLNFGIEDQMNRWLLIASLVVAVSGSSALAEDQRNVTVVNGTDDWSDNELPQNSVLPNGNSVYVKFNTADDGCKWNFKIEWADPGYPGVVWHDIDLCHVSTVTLKYDRATDKTTAELE